MNSITFRSLRPTDLHAVAAIDSRIVGQPRHDFFKKRLTIATAAPESFLTCAACKGDKLYGYAFARVQNGDFGSSEKVAILDVLGVDQGAQGKGEGRALLTGIEQRMAKKGIERLRTQIDWADRAMSGFFAATHFKLAPLQVVCRSTLGFGETVAEMSEHQMDSQWQVHGPGGNDYDILARDRVLTRSLQESDLAAIVRLDRHLTGEDRNAYYREKFQEMLVESGIRISLVAEKKNLLAGFIMARLDYGEFGRPIKTAVIDTLGVEPGEQHVGVGRALLSQLLINLSRVQVEEIHSQVAWQQPSLQRFLCQCGFTPSQRLVLEKWQVPS